MWPFKRRDEEAETKKPEFDYAAIRIGNVYILPPDEEDIKFFRERLEAQRRKKRREKMRLITRRSLLVGGAAAAVGLLTLPFLPKGSDLNPDDLLKPELAQANPQLMRELCLEFYANPKAEYRMAAATIMQSFTDAHVRAALVSIASGDPLAHIRKRAMLSLVNQQDAALHQQIASLYWADPELRGVVDSRVALFSLSALKTAIQQAKP